MKNKNILFLSLFVLMMLLYSCKNDVEEKVYTVGLEISKLPDKLNYCKEETLNLDGLEVKLNKSDGTCVILNDDEYTVEPEEGTILIEDGIVPIKINAEEKNIYFSVFVGKTVLSYIKVTNLPDKIYYNENEMLDLTGLEVTAVFLNGSEIQEKKIEYGEYKKSIYEGSPLSVGSGQKISISYGGKNTFIYINVGGTWETYTFEDDGSHRITDICRGNTNLRSIIIPETMKTIDDYAFFGCAALENVILPRDLEKIGDSAFLKCSSLRKVSFENVSNNVWQVVVSSKAFKDCENLVDIEFGDTTNKFYFTANSFENCLSLEVLNFKNAVVYGSIDSSANPSSAFTNCTSLSEVDFNGKSYGLGFRGCTALKTIKNSISYDLYEYCTSLAEIPIPALYKAYTNKDLVDNAFRGCTAISTIELHDSVKTISSHAFDGCTNLTTIIIPRGCNVIYSYAFANCTSLENIELPANLTSISEGLFKNCVNLKSIQYPDNLERIELDAFEGCDSLSQIIIPSTVTDLWVRSNKITQKLCYEGKKEEFNNLIKNDNWAENLKGKTIYCSDGSFVYGEE